MQKYPIGIQTFKKLIENGNVYVDKTSLIHKLITNVDYCFLSRPRRFGKSLTLSTIASIFRAERELFAGLAIDKSDYNWQKHPVVHISLGGVESVNEDELLQWFRRILKQNADRLEVDIPELAGRQFSIGSAFASLIEQAGKETPAVLLVDEYDKPLVNVLEEPELYERNRNIMAGFYRVIKDLDPYLRFTMLTGISRFGRLSLFSELNNLEDITYNDTYATLCGYTEDELEEYFSQELDRTNPVETRKEVQDWYKGYRFGTNTAEKVYNPFCLLQYFKNNNTLSGYWRNSGTTSLLVKLARRNNFFAIDLQNVSSSEGEQAVYSPDDVSFASLLLQTGYLTIDHVEQERNNFKFHLRVPNREVQGAIDDTVIKALTNQSTLKFKDSLAQEQIYDALLEADSEALKQELSAIFASLPYQHYDNMKTVQHYESYYASILLVVFQFLPGVEVKAEESSHRGRADLVLDLEGRGSVFVIEVKVDADIGKAVEQISRKGYLDRYKTGVKTGKETGDKTSKETGDKTSAKTSVKTSGKTSNKKLYAVGITFSTSTRNVEELAIVEVE